MLCMPLVGLLVTLPLGMLVGARDGRKPVGPLGFVHSLQDMYQGEDFFSEWSFFQGPDPTDGLVNYLGMQDAMNQGLAYVDNDKTVVLAVDSTNYVSPGGKRNSVRITSNKNYTGGLFILDVVAMPTGCSVWPAFWSNGPNWPHNGEMDIIEGVNNQVNNQMTLHSGTSDACTLDATSGAFTGKVLNTQCYSTQSSNSGCSILDTDPHSFGSGFNEVGGGVVAMAWESFTISIWHFPRHKIPQDITDQMPMITGWGEPVAAWDVASCNIVENFKNHSFIFDTTICGGWAAGAYGHSGCPGTCEEMVSNPANYAEAYWRIKSLAVYSAL